MADPQAADHNGRPPFQFTHRAISRALAPRGVEAPRCKHTTTERVKAHCAVPSASLKSEPASAWIAERWNTAPREASAAIHTAIARVRDIGRGSVRVVDCGAGAEIRWLECMRCGGSAATGPEGNERCRLCQDRMRRRSRRAGQNAADPAESNPPDGIVPYFPRRTSGHMPMRGPGLLWTDRRR